jgi:hypothetical protein
VRGSEARQETASTFIVAYYNAARADMTQRLILRESMLTVFLVAVTALTSVAFSGGSTQRYAFFAIPVLGFGVAASYVHHVTAVRALWTYLTTLWTYLTTEYQQDVKTCLGNQPTPRHFDVSAAHPEMASSRTMRLIGTVALIIVPEILATVAGAVALGLKGPSAWAFAVSVTAAAATTIVIFYGYMSRTSRERIAHRLRRMRRPKVRRRSATP